MLYFKLKHIGNFCGGFVPACGYISDMVLAEIYTTLYSIINHNYI
jgi:hypothetical protein